jgi:type I restriction enzyme, S subunit
MKYRLGDICTITKGETGIMKAISGAYTMVALGEANKTHTEFQFDTKAVIIPLVSSTGHGHASMKRVKYQEGKFALGNILCAVIPKNENFVLAKYLHIYLHWNREELLVSQMKGMANVSLSIGKIADVSVTVPSLEKQRQIVELEQKLVAKELIVEKLLTDQLTQLENLNQAILQEAVQGKLVKQNPKDEPASELLKRIKAEKTKSGKREKPLPPIKVVEIPFEIPESWVWCRLGEICDVNPRNKADDELEVGFIPMPLVSQLFGVLPSFETRKWGAIKTGFTHFANNDVVVAKITPCFENSKAGIISNLPNGIGAGTTELNVFRGNDFLLPQYIYSFVKRADFLVNGAKIMKGVSGQQRVPTEYFYSTLIPLPPLSEQTRIVAEIEKQLAKTKQLKEHIIANQHATEQLLKALLYGAFQPDKALAQVGEVKEMGIKAEEKERKVIEFKPTNVDYYKRTVIAAEIVWQLHKEPTLGHLKLQKLIYLCQKTADMQLPTNFLRQAMGPYDPQMMRSIDKQLKEKRWFEYHQTEVFKYQTLEKAGEHHTDFEKYFSVEQTSIQYILDTFKSVKSDYVEIVATLYACLAIMKNEKVLFSEALLVQRFYEWSEEKKKFDEHEIKKVYKRMVELGIVPK